MGSVGARRSFNKQQQAQFGTLKVGGPAISKRFIQSMQIYGALSVSGSQLMRAHCLLDCLGSESQRMRTSGYIREVVSKELTLNIEDSIPWTGVLA